MWTRQFVVVLAVGLLACVMGSGVEALAGGNQGGGECYIEDQGIGFGDALSWSTYDAGATPVDARGGYRGAVFDGRYVYFVPNIDESGPHGEVLRYDTLQGYGDASSWLVFDPSMNGVGDHAYGFSDGVFDGRYVYFVPIGPGDAYSGEVLRYDTAGDFSNASSWTTFDAEAAAIGSRYGYSSAVFDGQYIYFIPNYNAAHGEMLRYDTHSDFATPSSWQAFDLESQAISAAYGWWGGVFDGSRYIYFAPNDAGPGYQQHGIVLRYDTWGGYTDPSSWLTFETLNQGVVSSKRDYRGAAFDGTYVYFAPARMSSNAHGEVLRYDVRGGFSDVASWSTFDAGDHGVGVDPDGFGDALYDGRFVYFVPQDSDHGVPHGEVLRYDTTASFDDASSWAAFDAGSAGVGDDPDWFSGAAFDGQYIYFSPHYNGSEYYAEVLRYDTHAGWFVDCNGNTVPDECDILGGTSSDCNSNGIPDECDISEEASEDCDTNGVPDECEADFDADGVIDGCDDDIDDDGVFDDVDACVYGPLGAPVDCVGRPRGDMDEDCDIDLADFAVFMESFTGPLNQG